jgi:sporulation protein YlmC with PRC-barrel domain
MSANNASANPNLNPNSPNDNEAVITALINREVYTTSGVFVGSVTDVKLDFNELAISDLVVEDINRSAFELERGKSGFLIPYRWVRAVGDVVLIQDIVVGQQDAPKKPQPNAAD